jgi:hypothetical protein
MNATTKTLPDSSPPDVVHADCLRKPANEAYYDCDLAAEDDASDDAAEVAADDAVQCVVRGGRDDSDVTWDATAGLVAHIMAGRTPEARYRALAWAIHYLLELVCPEEPEQVAEEAQ